MFCRFVPFTGFWQRWASLHNHFLIIRRCNSDRPVSKRTGPITGSSVSHRIITWILAWLSLLHDKNSSLLKIIRINAQLFISCMGQRNCTTQIYKENLTSGISAVVCYRLICRYTCGFICLLSDSRGKHCARKVEGLQSFSLPKDIPWCIPYFHSTAEGTSVKRVSRDQRAHAWARLTVSWSFTSCLAIRHTGQIHDNFHKCDMPNAAQQSIITKSKNTATNNFWVWLFATFNLQLCNSLSPGFAFMGV